MKTSKNRLTVKGSLMLLIGVLSGSSCEKNDEATTEEISVGNYVMIATGQTKLYNTDGVEVTGLKSGDTFYGQDAYYLKGLVMSFKDNGNKTVSDLNSGLMWQQVPSSSGYTWQKAVDYCNNLGLGGYSDWRIPSCKELC